MQLHYTGPTLADLVLGSALPVPEGWPAEDHEEPDAALAAAKVESGLYVAAKPERSKEVTEEGTANG